MTAQTNTDMTNATATTKPTLARKVISYSLVAAMLHASVAPAIASTAQKKQQEQAQAAQNKDDAVTQMIELAAKHELNVAFIKETEAKKRAGRNIFSRMVDGVIELFTDNSEEIALDDANDETSNQLLALEMQAATEHAELIAELKQQKQTYQEKGFDAQSLKEQDQLIEEMNSRYDVLKGLMTNLKTAKGESAKDSALAALNKQLTDWQPKVAHTDMENLPWGTPKNDVREPIVAEQSDINKVSFHNNKNNHLNTAVGQWRETEYKIGSYFLNHVNRKSPQTPLYERGASTPLLQSHEKKSQWGDLIQKSNAGALNGMTAAGNWTVLNALPKEVQPKDLEANQDVQINDDIKALAKQLDHSPAKIYKWVHDNIEFVPTYGSIQGSAFTLETKRGNATDTASLLIALYRASNIPARYVYGTVDIPAKFAMNWVGGVNNIDAAGNLIGQGGIPHTIVMNASVPKYLRMEHVWVEANVDYIGSRGNLSADKTTNNMKQWIPLDASYKHYTRTKGIDFTKDVTFDAKQLVEQLKNDATIDEQTGAVANLNTTAINNAISDYQTRVETYLETKHPNAKIDDLLGKNDITPYKSDTLAPMLPYQVKTVVSDYQELPKEMRHYFKFNLYENVGILGQNSYGLPLYEYRIPTTELQGKPLSFSWIPENDAQQQKLENTITEEGLPINVWMTPELRLGDKLLKKEGRFRLGYDIKVRYGFESPNSTLPSTANKAMVVGEYHAIGYNMQGMSQAQIDRSKQTLQHAKTKLETYKKTKDKSTLTGLNKHDTSGAMLQATVQSYFAINDLQSKTHSSHVGVVQNNYMSFGTYTNSLLTIYRYGLPWKTKPIGMTMDIDRIRHQTVHKDNNKLKQQGYMQVQGLRESSNENLVPENIIAGSEGISAVKLLNQATTQGQRIYTFTSENQSNVISKLSAHSTKTLTEVKNALNSGHQVTISEKPIQFYDWKGAGYIIIDPQTSAGAYMLEGGTNGGFTELLATVDELSQCIVENKENYECTPAEIKKRKLMALAMGGLLTNFYDSIVKFMPTIMMELIIVTLTVMLSGLKRINKCHLQELGIFLVIAGGLGLMTDFMMRASKPSRIPAYGLVAILSMMPIMASASESGIRLMKNCDKDECVAKMHPGSEIPNIRVVNGFKTIYRVPNTSLDERAKQIARLKLGSDATLHEINNAADLEQVTCSKITMLKIPDIFVNGNRIKSPDFKFLSNEKAPSLVGRLGDFMFTDDDAQVIPFMNSNFERNWNKISTPRKPNTRDQIKRHLKKGEYFGSKNYVYINLRYLVLDNRLILENYLSTELTSEEKKQIILRK